MKGVTLLAMRSLMRQRKRYRLLGSALAFSFFVIVIIASVLSGMVSSLTSLERFAPLTLGIAFFNLVFLQGVIAIAASQDVTKASPADMQIHVLSAGFDFAFLFSFLLGLAIIVIAIVAREEIHPDYRDGSGPCEPGGMI